MSANQTAVQPAPRRVVRDAQTGKDFDIIPENRIDVIFAWISAAYSIVVIIYLTWLVLNMLYPQVGATDSMPARLIPILKWAPSKLIFYSAVGGAIGAAVNNLRSFIAWHAEERAFGWRFIWKYLAMPPLGGTLAVIVYGIVQSGLAVFTGNSAATNSTEVTSLSAFVTGTLAGYGAHQVFKWLDDKVNSLFKVESKQTTVPDVKGRSLDEAKKTLTDAQLQVGTVTETAASSDQIGKVIAQGPAAGIQSECGRKVDLTVGIAAPDVKVNSSGATDLTATPAGNGTSNGKPDKVEAPGATAGAATKSATEVTVAPGGSATTVPVETGGQTTNAEAKG